jgi:hypothetical protein
LQPHAAEEGAKKQRTGCEEEIEVVGCGEFRLADAMKGRNELVGSLIRERLTVLPILRTGVDAVEVAGYSGVLTFELRLRIVASFWVDGQLRIRPSQRDGGVRHIEGE